MKILRSKSCLALSVCLCLCPIARAQTAFRLVAERDLPGYVLPLGDLLVPGDSAILLTANGGLYCLNPPSWPMPPDSNNLLVSYLQLNGPTNHLFTVFHLRENKTCLYWRQEKDAETRVERLATLPGGLFRLLRQENALFLIGHAADTFRIYEYAADTLASLYMSKRFIPSDVRALSRDLLLLSVGNRIVSLHRTEGLKELFNLEEPVSSFVIKDGTQLIVSTPTGLYTYSTGTLHPIAVGITGRLFFEKNTLFMLHAEARKLYSFR